MAKPARKSEPTVRLPIIDRLIDGGPGSVSDRTAGWEASVAELRCSLHRDLEWLLNTRRIVEPAPDSLIELQRSVYHYGLADITSLSGDSEATRRQLTRQIEECIRLFEPRLTGVRVSAVDDGAEGGRRIRFVIEGLLRLDPDPERVVFDTVLETVSGKFQVTGAVDA